MNVSEDRFHEMFTMRPMSQFRWREAIHGLTYNEAKESFAAAVRQVVGSSYGDVFAHYLWGYVKIISNHTKFAFGWSDTLYHDSLEAHKGKFMDGYAERLVYMDDFIDWSWHLLVMAYAIIERSESDLMETWNN